MKIITVGYNHTDRLSLHHAFSKLGYKIDGFLDHFWKYERIWNKLLTSGGTKSSLELMYSNVDVVLDPPALFFWKELCDVFPDAKNSDECFNDWFDYAQAKKQSRTFYVMQLLSFTGWKYLTFKKNVFGFFNSNISLKHLSKSLPLNEMMLRQKFRQHYADIIQNAPRDKILFYDVCEGWKPLCEFLGEEIPHQTPLEHVDDRIFSGHPLLLRIRKEAIISSIAIAALTITCSHYLTKHWRSIQHDVATGVIKLWYRTL